MIITKELFKEICPKGYLSKEQLSLLGMQRPLQKNWRREVIGKNINQSAIEKLIYLGNLSEKDIRKIERDRIKRSKKIDKAIKRNNVVGIDFLQSYEWKKLRLQALMLYGSTCQCCGASPKTGAVMNVDHIKPRKLFPELAMDINNLQVLCSDCNHGKGNWVSVDFRQSY